MNSFVTAMKAVATAPPTTNGYQARSRFILQVSACSFMLSAISFAISVSSLAMSKVFSNLAPFGLRTRFVRQP